MTDSSAFGFGKFIPGFDFLQNLGKAGQGTGGMPAFAHWVAPTVSVEEIEKRIEELKAVQFWLEQNSRALSATVQALEVQRMTLSTLKGMNVNLSDLGKAFPFAASAAATAASSAPGHASTWPMPDAAPAAAPAPAAPPVPHPAAPEAARAKVQAPAAPHASDAPASAAQAASMANAMQWWSALTQQFQHIAQQALQDPSQQQALLKATQMGSEYAQTAVKTASEMVRQAVAKAPADPAGAAAAAKAAPAKKAAAKAAAPGKAPAKKVAAADKKAPAAAATGRRAAAPKSGMGKPRSR